MTRKSDKYADKAAAAKDKPKGKGKPPVKKGGKK